MIKTKGIIVFAAVLLLGACGKPKIVPDDELARIFHDVYLTNAYADTRSVELDSLNIYEPVFSRYGYTSEDVQFTIGNFAKRKSARLSDVVEEAIAMIARESRFYSSRIAMQDTLRRIAGERYVTIADSVSSIRVRRIADTARLHISIPARPGKYDISYSYLVDSTDDNNIRPARFYFLDSTGHERNPVTRSMRRLERERISVTMSADSLHRSLELDLNGYTEGMSDPEMRIDSVVVKYYIPDNEALERMARELFDYRVLDSLWKLYETPLVPPVADSVGLSSR